MLKIWVLQYLTQSFQFWSDWLTLAKPGSLIMILRIWFRVYVVNKGSLGPLAMQD